MVQPAVHCAGGGGPPRGPLRLYRCVPVPHELRGGEPADAGGAPHPPAGPPGGAIHSLAGSTGSQ